MECKPSIEEFLKETMCSEENIYSFFNNPSEFAQLQGINLDKDLALYIKDIIPNYYIGLINPGIIAAWQAAIGAVSGAVAAGAAVADAVNNALSLDKEHASLTQMSIRN